MADLTGANLRAANLTGAELTGARFGMADLCGANISRSWDLEGAKVDAATTWPEGFDLGAAGVIFVDTE